MRKKPAVMLGVVGTNTETWSCPRMVGDLVLAACR